MGDYAIDLRIEADLWLRVSHGGGGRREEGRGVN
jgi:hypothetical protein